MEPDKADRHSSVTTGSHTGMVVSQCVISPDPPQRTGLASRFLHHWTGYGL
ncbi:hypothetical protein [Algoriphagus sp. Y33]|uniref:hypothetical protein n=1 Tax=Algoriphagus sp. Y33 TaxID=2772483 RepID=UPI00177F5496|nr:hypothetical protein [Algoriphagus sp. Y33]